jgi:hypothetical protein
MARCSVRRKDRQSSRLRKSWWGSLQNRTDHRQIRQQTWLRFVRQRGPLGRRCLCWSLQTCHQHCSSPCSDLRRGSRSFSARRRGLWMLQNCQLCLLQRAHPACCPAECYCRWGLLNRMGCLWHCRPTSPGFHRTCHYFDSPCCLLRSLVCHPVLYLSSRSDRREECSCRCLRRRMMVMPLERMCCQTWKSPLCFRLRKDWSFVLVCCCCFRKGRRLDWRYWFVRKLRRQCFLPT